MVLAKDEYVMEALLRVQETWAGIPPHPDSATSAVLFFQEALRFTCVHDMVRFVELTKLVYVENNGNVLEKVCWCFLCCFFNAGKQMVMLVSALKRYPNCMYMLYIYRYMGLCVFICV